MKPNRNKRVAIIASFSVIYAFLRIIPTFPLIGMPGASFSTADILAPLYGIILGATLGSISIILGTFLAIIFGKPLIFLGLDFLPGISAAIITSLLIRGNRKISIVALILIPIIYWGLPLTDFWVNVRGTSIPYNWMHITIFLLIISPLYEKLEISNIQNSIKENRIKTTTVISLLLVFYTGTLFQHMVGGIMFVTTMGIIQETITPDAFPGLWKTFFYLYPIERTILAIITTILSIPLLKTLYKNKINIE